MGRPPLIRAMPERKRFFPVDVFPYHVNCQLNIQVDYYHDYISVIIMRIFSSIDNVYFEEDHFDFIRNCKERAAQSNSSSEDVAAGLIFLGSFFAVHLFLLILGRVRMARIKTDAKWPK